MSIFVLIKVTKLKRLISFLMSLLFTLFLMSPPTLASEILPPNDPTLEI